MAGDLENSKSVNKNESASKSLDADFDRVLAETALKIVEAAQSKPDQVEDKLHLAEQDLLRLKASSNEGEFKVALKQLEDRVNSPTDRGQQFLPLLDLWGIDQSGQILVKDWSTGAVERLSVDNGVLGPNAPVDES